MISWCTADYVILTASAIAGVMGLFIGFSGTMAFLAATIVSALAGKVVWALSAGYLATNWSRGLATVLITLLIFGLVRWAVRRIVNGLLKQPADSIFGFLLAAVSGLGVTTLVVYLINFFQILDIPSVFVSEAAGLFS